MNKKAREMDSDNDPEKMYFASQQMVDILQITFQGRKDSTILSMQCLANVFASFLTLYKKEKKDVILSTFSKYIDETYNTVMDNPGFQQSLVMAKIVSKIQ